MMAQATKVNGKKKSKIKNQKSLALDDQRLFPPFSIIPLHEIHTPMLSRQWRSHFNDNREIQVFFWWSTIK
jgi:hypothetical protein